MKLPRRLFRGQGVVLAVLGAVFLLRYPGVVRNIMWVLALLQGRANSDFVQDWVAARAMLYGEDPYPTLGPVFASLGLTSFPQHVSTHPPTAFLFALPLAPLPWPAASAAWLILMLACIAATVLVFRPDFESVLVRGPERWMALALASLALLWPPVLLSLAQSTPIWLLGMTLAWRARTSPALAGGAVGVASLGKYMAASLLLPLLLRRKWQVLAGFCVVWLLALALVFAIRSDIIPIYLEANGGEALRQMARRDNGALLFAAWQIGSRTAGWIGAWGAAIGVVGLIAWVAFTILFRRVSEADRWACSAWLGVALLPIAWAYSLLPLLPWVLARLWHGTLAPRILACAAFLSPLMWFPARPENPRAIVLCMVFAGLAFSLSGNAAETAGSACDEH